MKLLGLEAMRSRETPLASLVESYMLSRHDWAESTRKWVSNYLSDFSRFVERRQEREATIGDLDILIVNAYVGEKRLRSEHTARAAAVTLRGLGGFMEESGIVERNPLAKLKIPKPPEDVRQPLRDDVARKLLGAAGDCPRPTQAARDQAIVALMLECGVRIKECRLIEIDDVDWTRRRLVIRSVTTKGKRVTRDIRLGAAAPLLNRYVRDYRPDGPGVLFLTLSGKPLAKGGMDSLIDHIVKRTGIDFSAHILRHTWATNFRRFKAGDLLDMQEEAGWSSKSMAKMARKYSHPKAFEERERITPLAGLMRIA